MEALQLLALLIAPLKGLQVDLGLGWPEVLQRIVISDAEGFS